MALNIATREKQGVTILDLSGKILLGPESQALRERINQLLTEKKNKILLNLKDVTYIDSTGVGTLVSAYTSARSQGGYLRLSNLSQRFQETLHLTRLVTVFEIHKDEGEALAKFS